MANIINGTDTGSGGLITTGDSSDELQLQTAETARVTLTNTAVVVNEDGNDVDFRVEGDTNANLLFVDAGNDRIGVGIDTPQQVLDIASGGKIYLRRTDNTTGATISSDGPGNGLVCHELNGEPFIWKHSSELMRISADATPYLRLASGTGGIQFGGDTAAANALDDYEEGTWTPTLLGSVSNPTVTYTYQVGRYTKIGNLVQINLIFTTSAVSGGSGDLRIGGLPFAPVSGNFFEIFKMNLGEAQDMSSPITSGPVVSASISATFMATDTTVAGLNNGAGQNRIRINGVYIAA